VEKNAKFTLQIIDNYFQLYIHLVGPLGRSL